MANAAILAGQATPIRAMVLGYPKSGKTGAIAPLIDAGFKLRIIDFDGNLDPMFQFVKDKSKLANVDVLSFEDKMRIGAQYQEPLGIPTAFADALKSFDKWVSVDPVDGSVTDLGSSKDWGPDTIVVLDSLTEMGNAALNRVMKLMNKNPLNATWRVQGVAQKEQEEFAKRLTSKANKFHVLALAHLKMVGPKDIEQGDDDYTKELKKRAGSIVATRLYPSALGQALPPVIGSHFPTLLLVEPRFRPGNKVERVITAVPRPELDLGIPHPDLVGELPISTGLLDVFKALSPGSVALVQRGVNQ